MLVSDLDALRSAFDLERILLLGYSFGAELALEYAIAHPSRVLGLILQAPSGVAEPERTRSYSSLASQLSLAML